MEDVFEGRLSFFWVFLWEEGSEKKGPGKVQTLYPYLNRHWCAGRTDSGVERPMVKELGNSLRTFARRRAPV